MKKISFDMPEVDMDDRGVSPVIGVILMVAITVILAAVIASFVLGFGDSVSQNVQAGASISVNTDNSSAMVTWVSEGNAKNISVSGSGISGGGDITTVGGTLTVTGVADGDTIVVTANGKDGSSTVVAQKTVGN